MTNGLYAHNNGKGWAVWKPNPIHPHKRAFAWHAEAHKWSLIVATYYDTEVEADAVMASLTGNEEHHDEGQVPLSQHV